MTHNYHFDLLKKHTKESVNINSMQGYCTYLSSLVTQQLMTEGFPRLSAQIGKSHLGQHCKWGVNSRGSFKISLNLVCFVQTEDITSKASSVSM